MNFVFSVPSNVIFGEGVSQQVGQMVVQSNCKKVLCIYDKGIKEAGIAGKIIDNIKHSNIEIVTFEDVIPDPPVEVVEKAAAIAAKEGIDGIVAIGGGSSIDTAKAVNILLGNGGSLMDYEGINQVPKRGVPLIAIPSTSGTGSEVTVASVITDNTNSRKVVIVGNNVGCDLAILDPLLTLGLPKSITAATGMDAFSHAVEALTTTLATPMTDALAIEAASMIYENFATAVSNGNDAEARAKMMMGSMIAGIAFSNGFVHLGHAMAHAMGAKWHIPHGVVCAIALPYALEHNVSFVPDKIRRLGMAMGLALDKEMTDQDMADLVIDKIKSLSKMVGIPTLQELGVEKEAIEEICDQTMNELTIHFSHNPVTRETVKQILESMFHEN